MEKMLMSNENESWWAIPLVKPATDTGKFVNDCQCMVFRGLSVSGKARKVNTSKLTMMLGWPDAHREIDGKNYFLTFRPAMFDTFYNLVVDPYKSDKKTIGNDELQEMLGYGDMDFKKFVAKFKRYVWVGFLQWQPRE